MRHVSKLMISVLLLSAIADPAEGCSVVFAVTETGPNFLVKVERWGHLAEGLPVTITAEQGRNSIVAYTDVNGIARFAKVPAGHYSVLTPRAGTLELEAAINVKWPYNVVSARSLRGFIRSIEWVPGKIQSSLDFGLSSGLSGKEVQRFRTDQTGEFNLRDTPPGVYLLDLKPSGVRTSSGSQLAGRIYVSVEPNARAEDFDLSLGWTSCGLYYSDAHSCEPRDLVLGLLSGEVTDPSGAAIADAQIELMDSSGTSVEHLTSNRFGEFSLSRPLDGTYTIVISKHAFTLYRGTVRLNPLNPALNNRGMVAQLGIAGSCSAARTF